jgi:hypothetical protein
MVDDLPGYIALFEGLGNLVFTIFGVIDARKLRTHNFAVSLALIAGVILNTVLHGLGTANVGTAIRHR